MVIKLIKDANKLSDFYGKPTFCVYNLVYNLFFTPTQQSLQKVNKKDSYTNGFEPIITHIFLRETSF